MPTPIGTTGVYNGQQILGCELLLFEQVEVRDDSQTDQVYDRVRIRLRGMIHTQVPVTHGVLHSPTINTGVPVSNRFIALQQTMMEVGEEFSLYIDNGELLFAAGPFSGGFGTGTGAAGYADVRNGPHPVDFKIIKVVSNRTLKIEFEIECCIVSCATLTNGAGILSNRWGWTEMIDENWFTRRILNGRMVLASATINIHAFRTKLIPRVQQGFKRELIQVVSSPDGLTMDYTVVDMQMKYSTPYPGTKIKGTHVVSQTQNGAMAIHKIDFTLAGPPDVDKRALISLAAKIAVDRTNGLLGSNTAAPTGYLVDYTMIDYIDDTSNAVGMSVLIQCPGGAAGTEELPNAAILDVSRIGTNFSLSGYNPKVSNCPPPYACTDASALLITYLQSPCDNIHDINNASSGTGIVYGTGASGGDGTRIINVVASDLGTGTGSTPFASDHVANAYTNYQIDTHLHHNSVKAQMALGASQTGGTQDTSAVVDLSAGSVLRQVVRVHAERQGAPPVLPDFKDYTSTYDTGSGSINPLKFTYLHSRTVFSGVELSADGVSYNYSHTCDYIFAVNRPLASTDLIALPTMPWQSRYIGSNQLVFSSLFQTGLIG